MAGCGYLQRFDALDDLVREFAVDCQVVRLGHPGLVLWAEALVSGAEPPQQDLDQAMQPLREAGVDTVVLGCTHYPLLLPWLRKSLPDVRYWVESGEAIARRVAYWLEEAGRLPEAEAPREAGLPVVREACFTGEVAPQMDLFLAEIGIPVGQVTGHWPGVTAAGSV